MDPLKRIRWQQRFKNFEKSYHVLEKYVQQPIKTELERAGLIQLFEMTFELGWKVLKDYAEEAILPSPNADSRLLPTNGHPDLGNSLNTRPKTCRVPGPL